MTVEKNFMIGNDVWFLYSDKVIKGRIRDIGQTGYTIDFGSDLQYQDYIKKERVFKTKEELIESLFN